VIAVLRFKSGEWSNSVNNNEHVSSVDVNDRMMSILGIISCGISIALSALVSTVLSRVRAARLTSDGLISGLADLNQYDLSH